MTCGCFGRGPPEKSVAKQPAGYQAVLRATLHEAAVSAACIASKAGLVALGDASGDLSVLNLCRVRSRCPAGLELLLFSDFANKNFGGHFSNHAQPRHHEFKHEVSMLDTVPMHDARILAHS